MTSDDTAPVADTPGSPCCSGQASPKPSMNTSPIQIPGRTATRNMIRSKFQNCLFIGCRALVLSGRWFLAFCLVGLFVSLPTESVAAYQAPSWLPRYELDVHIDVPAHYVYVKERVTWTNPHDRPAEKIVFNNHSHYTVPDAEVGKLAKMLEILRLAPSDALDFNGPPCQIQKITLVDVEAGKGEVLPFAYQPQNDTALEVPLPLQVTKGQSVTLEVQFALRLPQRQGRWGQWRGVTFLAQWLPVVAYYDNGGWHPTPFVPWHQPFLNEAGFYKATITYPVCEKLGCTGSIVSRKDLGNGWQQVQVGNVVARDFAIFCSEYFREVVGKVGEVRLRCLHLPGHEHYGRQMIHIAQEAIPVYSKWFGPFPYPEFTVVESYFGWNGNECGGLVMIDERVFGMPHLAYGFVDHLLTHEIGHQWFYNVVGTNGYAETWMDEGVVTSFSHHVMDLKVGKNNKMLKYPPGLRWLPNIHRGDYSNYGWCGVVGRGEHGPTVQEMPKYGHLVNLLAMTYDRGGKVVGMIEERLGKASMLDFMRHIYRKYYFRVLHVADFQRELETFTGRSWQQFFDEWVYGAGMADWAIEDVRIEPINSPSEKRRHRWLKKWIDKSHFLSVLHGHARTAEGPYRVVVLVGQHAKISEPTVLGFSLDGTDNYQIRVPILPDTPFVVMEEVSAKMEALTSRLVRVEIILPSRPTQIVVDPDHVLVDRERINNAWKLPLRFRVTPLYLQIDETDLTNAYDKVNIIMGPWAFGSTYNDPWFGRSEIFGVRAGVYRTQKYYGGAYLGLRTNDRNLLVGLDGLWDHVPLPNTQIGFVAEHSLATLDSEEVECSRGVLFGRYIFTPGSSLYLPPFEYVEGFGTIQNRCLPDLYEPIPDTRLFNEQTTLGVHYHKYYLTPYWDPEGGLALDATYQAGLPILESPAFHKLFGQVSFVKYTPDPFGFFKATPGLHWLTDTRWAFRLHGAAALPDNGLLFTLGGGDYFRGFDLQERQGSLIWLASVEARVPIIKGLRTDLIDHVAGIRNIYLVAFYDVGNAYINGRETGSIAQAVGGGLRVDVTWFGLIERTMLRLDVAQTVSEDSPAQVWFGIMHPF